MFFSPIAFKYFVVNCILCCLCKFYFQVHQYESQPKVSVQPFECIRFTISHVYCPGF